MKPDSGSIVKTPDTENTTKKAMVNIKILIMKNQFP